MLLSNTDHITGEPWLHTTQLNSFGRLNGVAHGAVIIDRNSLIFSTGLSSTTVACVRRLRIIC